MQPTPPSWRDELRGPSSEAMRARAQLAAGIVAADSAALLAPGVGLEASYRENASQAPTLPDRRSVPYDAPQPPAPADTLTTGAVHASRHARASVSVSDGTQTQTAQSTRTPHAAP